MQHQKPPLSKSPINNGANENGNAFADTKALHRIKQKNERNSTFQRLSPLNRGIHVLVVALALWSALTEGSFLVAGFFGMTNHWGFTLGITILLVVLLESTKYFLGTYTLRFVVCGWLMESWRYVVAFAILAPIMCSVFYGSYYLSVNGAPRIATFFTKKTEQLDLVKLDSIQFYYDNKVNVLAEAQSEAKKTTWNGVTTNTATKLATSYQTQINLIETERQKALEIARSHNIQTLENSKYNSTDWGVWLSRFGGYGEILTLFFLLFIEFYDRASYLELPNHDEATTVEKTTVPKRPTMQNDLPIPIQRTQSLPLSDKKNPSVTTSKTIVVVNGKVPYEGKQYDESRFKDWMNKARYRAENNKKASSRKTNKERYESLVKAFDLYQKSIQA